MKIKMFLTMFFLLCTTVLFGTENSFTQGFDYKTRVFKEKEPNNTFKESWRIIVPVPDVKDRIEGTIDKFNDTDIFLIYLTRPVDVRIFYGGYSGFMPGVAIFNQYKKLVKIKTYASAYRSYFNSRFIDFKLFKPGFYYLKIRNLINIKGKFRYEIKFIPVDISEYSWIKIIPKKNIANLTQDKLHEIFYKNIIRRFKTYEQNHSFK